MNLAELITSPPAPFESWPDRGREWICATCVYPKCVWAGTYSSWPPLCKMRAGLGEEAFGIIDAIAREVKETLWDNRLAKLELAKRGVVLKAERRKRKAGVVGLGVNGV